MKMYNKYNNDVVSGIVKIHALRTLKQVNFLMSWYRERFFEYKNALLVQSNVCSDNSVFEVAGKSCHIHSSLAIDWWWIVGLGNSRRIYNSWHIIL